MCLCVRLAGEGTASCSCWRAEQRTTEPPRHLCQPPFDPQGQQTAANSICRLLFRLLPSRQRATPFLSPPPPLHIISTCTYSHLFSWCFVTNDNNNDNNNNNNNNRMCGTGLGCCRCWHAGCRTARLPSTPSFKSQTSSHSFCTWCVPCPAYLSICLLACLVVFVSVSLCLCVYVPVFGCVCVCLPCSHSLQFALGVDRRRLLCASRNAHTRTRPCVEQMHDNNIREDPVADGLVLCVFGE